MREEGGDPWLRGAVDMEVGIEECRSEWEWEGRAD
jgi:hypothetical protein